VQVKESIILMDLFFLFLGEGINFKITFQAGTNAAASHTQNFASLSKLRSSDF
jgi:hypothetical protein